MSGSFISGIFSDSKAQRAAQGVYVPNKPTYMAYACLYQNGADVGSRVPVQMQPDGMVSQAPFFPPGPGTYTTRNYSAQTGGTLLSESAPIVVPADAIIAAAPGAPAATPAVPAETGTLSGVPNSATAGSALVGTGAGNVITFNASNVSTPYAALVTNAATVGQAVGSALIGSAVALSGSSGTVPAITPPAAATDYLALLDGPTGKVLALSGAITVAAAAAPAQPVTLTGLPASISAGQPLSMVGFAVSSSTYGAFVLWDATAGAEEGPHFTDSVTPDSTLDVLVPQNAGHSYTVRLVSIGQTPQTTLWESPAFNVTAAPGALPAVVGAVASSNATTSSVTASWAAIAGATGYLIQARDGVGQKYGSLVNATISAPSITFTGLTSGAAVFFYITAINANGRGLASQAGAYAA